MPKFPIAWTSHSRVKCDCGHYPKDHYRREGWCDKCGCTWYWPNVRYQARKKKEAEQNANSSKAGGN